MKTIVWDVDDVLNDLMRSWFELEWLPSHLRCALRYDDIVENPPHRLLGVTLEEYQSSLDGFRLSEAGRQLSPRSEVVEWFRQYGSDFRHVALTATPMNCASLSAAWVTWHFGAWIRSFSFVPSARSDQNILLYDQSKADFLRWWGRADALVDDSPSNVTAARSLGLEAVLVPHPWNAGRSTIVESLQSLVEAME